MRAAAKHEAPPRDGPAPADELLRLAEPDLPAVGQDRDTFRVAHGNDDGVVDRFGMACAVQRNHPIQKPRLCVHAAFPRASKCRESV